MNTINIRNIRREDCDSVIALISNRASILRPFHFYLHYVYTIICNQFNKTSFLLEENNDIVGAILTIESSSSILIPSISLRCDHYNQDAYNALLLTAYNAASKIGKKLQVAIHPSDTDTYDIFTQFCKKNRLEFVAADVNNCEQWRDKSKDHTLDVFFDDVRVSFHLPNETFYEICSSEA